MYELIFFTLMGFWGFGVLYIKINIYKYNIIISLFFKLVVSTNFFHICGVLGFWGMVPSEKRSEQKKARTLDLVEEIIILIDIYW